MQSILSERDRPHVAIIMDGNGRWATRRRLPRALGHRAGLEAVRRIAEAAPGLGIGTLTLFAFSSDNWRRPAVEIGALMGLLRLYLRTQTPHLVENGLRLTVIGRRDRLPDGIAAEIDRAEAATEGGHRLHLRIALDYSSRYAIAQAAANGRPAGAADPETLAQSLSLQGGEARDVDLLVRTGGEQRLSDFLLWECAYAELLFTELMWPDFGAADLAAALAEYRRRDRRFGGLPENPALAFG